MSYDEKDFECAKEMAVAVGARKEAARIEAQKPIRKLLPEKPARAPRSWNRASRRAYMSNRYGKRSTGFPVDQLEQLRSARKRRNKAAKQARRRNRK